MVSWKAQGYSLVYTYFRCHLRFCMYRGVLGELQLAISQGMPLHNKHERVPRWGGMK